MLVKKFKKSKLMEMYTMFVNGRLNPVKTSVLSKPIHTGSIQFLSKSKQDFCQYREVDFKVIWKDKGIKMAKNNYET